MRFFPEFKARYDYGLLIFILTFCLISVSGYRDDEVIDMAVTRFTTILIGGTAAVLTCVVISPVWAGTDLHNMVADNIEKLGTFLDGILHFLFPSFFFLGVLILNSFSLGTEFWTVKQHLEKNSSRNQERGT